MSRYRGSNKGWLWGLIIGIIVAVAIFCVVIAIASEINDVSFGQQIVDWFGKTTEKVVENTTTTPTA